MPRYASNPDLLDHALSLSLTDLKRLGYLKEHHSISGVVNWNRHGQVIGSVSVAVDVVFGQVLELAYKSSGKEHRQIFQLVSKPSNLSKGRYWLIQSPVSGKLGRKLYNTGAGFQIRADLTGCMYEDQTKSKSFRNLSNLLDRVFRSEELMMHLYRRGFRKYYAGKPTRRYLKLLGRLEQSEGMKLSQVLNTLV